MDIQLFVYDLSRGLARQLSLPLLGRHIDAVYHTSIVIDGVEYFFGQGVQTCYAGSTHHGAPIEIIPLGNTSIPIDIILEYLENLKEVYTAESYDLFTRNCNNFSHDFSMFLVGRGIPDHITSLPEAVLNTPFGQMLRPQIDSAMRSITQAPVPVQTIPRKNENSPSISGNTAGVMKNRDLRPNNGEVHDVTSQSELQSLLDASSDICVVLFFTSSNYALCKEIYPIYDELAREAGDKAILVKIDVDRAVDVASTYNVQDTPTFVTFLNGKRESEWRNATPSEVSANVRLLLKSTHAV